MKLVAHSLTAALTLLAVAPTALAEKDKNLGRGITRTEFNGWTDAIHFESKDALPKAIVVPAYGGRVLSYGLRGENILWEGPKTPGHPDAEGPSPALPGGYFCSFGPEAAALPLHPTITSKAYEWSVKKGRLLALRSGEDKGVGAELEREIMFDPATGELGFVQRLKNISERDAAFTLVHRIACRPGGYVLAPINKKSRFPAGWSVRKVVGGKPAFDGTNPQVDGVRVLDGVLVAKTGTAGTKVGLDSDGQWLAYVLGRTLFVIHFPYYSTSVYSEGGNSVTFSWTEEMTELQPVSAETRLRSKRASDLPMKWSLVELPAEPGSFEEARALVPKIPASPFQ